MALLTESWSYDSAVIFLSLFIVLYLYFTRNFKYWKKRGVKEIKPIPFFGNFAPFLLHQKSCAKLLQEYYKAGEHEPYIGLYSLDKPILYIRDPKLIKNILIKDFNYFTSRAAKSSKSDIIGNMNLFFVKNPTWKYVRQKLTPVFTSGKLKKMLELMLEIDSEFVKYLESLHLEGNGRSIEVKEICATFTTDLIGVTAYGLRFNALGNSKSIVREKGKDIFKETYFRFLEFSATVLMPSIVDIFGFKTFGEDVTKFMRSLFWEAIDERRKLNRKGRGDLIDFLIDLKNNQEENPGNNIPKFDDDFLVAQATVFFSGGFETSSTTMSFALYELAKHPAIQERSRQEIFDELDKNNGKITYEMITSSLPYLDMVVSETLRMYPIVPFLDRMTETDYQVPDDKLVVEAGTPVLIPLQSLQMDEKYFPEPHVFDPERFSEENKKHIKSNTYFPFGDGPRICIGMRLGLLQTKLGLIRLISQYEFSPSKDTSSTIEFNTYTAFLSSRNGIILNVKKYRSKDENDI